jgi:pimeloyl-ACP methyl ester carboxylesterase
MILRRSTVHDNARSGLECGSEAPAASPDGHPPVKRRSWFGYALATASVLAVCAGGAFYWRPWWVIDESIRAWLRWAGFRSKYVRLDSCRVHYYVGGRGKPLVLVHGLGAMAESWTEAMIALARHGYQVYAIDLPGFGRSDRPDVDYSITFQAETLKQFFESQNLARADLGGWSMGGWVALKFTLDHPERVRRVFLVDSAGLTFTPSFDTALFRPTTVDQAQQLLGLLMPQAARIPRFVARDLVRQMRPTGWVVERATNSMMAGSDLLDGKLPAIRIPALIVWGKQDALIPLSCGEEMHRQMPQSQLSIFDGCGHMIPAECCGRLVMETVHFLEADPPLPASVREFPPDSLASSADL